MLRLPLYLVVLLCIIQGNYGKFNKEEEEGNLNKEEEEDIILDRR